MFVERPATVGKKLRKGREFWLLSGSSFPCDDGGTLQTTVKSAISLAKKEHCICILTSKPSP